MGDFEPGTGLPSPVESELSREELKKKADLLRGAMNSIIIKGFGTTKGWEEYRIGRDIPEGREFDKLQGPGQGYWIVDDHGPYTEYNYVCGKKETKIVLQPGGSPPYADPVILVEKIEGREEGTEKPLKKQVHRNTPSAVSGVVEFIKEINDGKTPDGLVHISSVTSEPS